MSHQNESLIEEVEKSKPYVRKYIAIGRGDSNSDTSALKSLFQIALDTRNFEINQLVQRNNFFMIFQGVLLSGVMQSIHLKPVVSFCICMAGLVVSIFQVRMASGAKLWHECWEQILQEVERELVEHLGRTDPHRKMMFRLFHDDAGKYRKMVKERLQNNGFGIIDSLIMRRYSVSKTPIQVALVLSIIWLILVLCTLRAYPPLGIPSFIVGF